MKDKVNRILNGRFFGIFITWLIILNVAAIILESHKGLKIYDRQFYIFEVVSVLIFSVEYIFRILIAPQTFPESKQPRLRFVFSTMGIIDLLSILPFYLPFLIPVDLRFLRLLRIFRITRVAKLHRHSEAIQLITESFRER